MKSATGSVKLIWVPAHAGTKGNQPIDGLAKEASHKISSDVNHVLFADFRKNLKKSMYDDATQIVEEAVLSKGTGYFKSFYTNMSKPWFFNKNLRRELIVMINIDLDVIIIIYLHHLLE